jgi:hypothetical protein
MSVLFKAILAFTVVLAGSGQLRLETPRWRAVAVDLAAAHPLTILKQQIRHLLADEQEPV